MLYLAPTRPEDASFPVSLMKESLAGGAPQVVLKERAISNLQCARAPSTLCLFSKIEGDAQIFVSFDPKQSPGDPKQGLGDPEHGAGRELARTTSGFTNWTLSPDGKMLAVFLDPHRIRFFNLITGRSHDISVNDWRLANGDWSADGRSLFMQSVTSEDKSVILAVDETGKTDVVWEGDASTRFDWLIQSPDGRQAILEADVPGDNNAWMVESF